jgi:hypothetical protein
MFSIGFVVRHGRAAVEFPPLTGLLKSHERPTCTPAVKDGILSLIFLLFLAVQRFDSLAQP